MIDANRKAYYSRSEEPLPVFNGCLLAPIAAPRLAITS
jgi:hypothetical protein